MRIYEYDAVNGWTQLGTDLDGDGHHNTFGHSVSLSSDGNRVAIGAPGQVSFWPQSSVLTGYTRVFDYDAVNGWTQVGTDILGNADYVQKGLSVSLSADGNRMAVGSAFGDQNIILSLIHI